MFIAKILYRMFKTDINKLVFEHQMKTKPEFPNLRFAFADSKGRKYYRFHGDELKMPIERRASVEKIGMQLRRMISDTELELFLSGMKKALYDAVYNKKTDGIAKIGFLLEEMDRRQDMLIHKDIFYSLVAALHIREDEKPHVFNEDVHAEKIKQFEVDSKYGMYDFFLRAGLGEYISYFRKLEGRLEYEMEKSQGEIQATKEMVNSILSGQK